MVHRERNKTGQNRDQRYQGRTMWATFCDPAPSFAIQSIIICNHLLLELSCVLLLKLWRLCTALPSALPAPWWWQTEEFTSHKYPLNICGPAGLDTQRCIKGRYAAAEPFNYRFLCRVDIYLLKQTTGRTTDNPQPVKTQDFPPHSTSPLASEMVKKLWASHDRHI